MGPSNEICRDWIGLRLTGGQVEYWPDRPEALAKQGSMPISVRYRAPQ
jgi:hypothetical protein